MTITSSCQFYVGNVSAWLKYLVDIDARYYAIKAVGQAPSHKVFLSTVSDPGPSPFSQKNY
jgi:hypothetical protein